MFHRLRLVALFALTTLAACGSPPPGTGDGGPTDDDAGATDAGVDSNDGGEGDAGAGDAGSDGGETDAGLSDAGFSDGGTDAGVDGGVDAGVSDGGVDAGADAGFDAGVDAGQPDSGTFGDGGTLLLRVMAANTTSGNAQSYDPGHGIRMFLGLKPDVVLIQEFNYGSNSAADLQAFMDTAFPQGFVYFRESGAQIPNGVISRWPIIASGKWTDPQVSNRSFVWARIDLPGPKDLWAVSLHLLTSSATTRNAEAQSLVNQINANIPAGDYLVLGGDFNTDTRSEACLNTLSSVVETSAPAPIDQNANPGTNATRSKPYDWVLADPDLNPLRTTVVVGNSSYPTGLVFDSRVYTPLSEVSPVLSGDSAAPNMQHMPVVKDFNVPY